MTQFEELIDAFNALAKAHASVVAQLRAMQSERLVDQDLLGALIVSHPDLIALRHLYLQFSSATHAQRTVKASTLGAEQIEPGVLQELSSVQARRMAHWQSVIDETLKQRE